MTSRAAGPAMGRRRVATRLKHLAELERHLGEVFLRVRAIRDGANPEAEDGAPLVWRILEALAHAIELDTGAPLIREHRRMAGLLLALADGVKDNGNVTATIRAAASALSAWGRSST